MIEFDPATMAIVWQYAGSAEWPFESAIRSDQQRLANGNTLITELSGGRILEVTRAGDIVWQFVNPVRGGEGGHPDPDRLLGAAPRPDSPRSRPPSARPGATRRAS